MSNQSSALIRPRGEGKRLSVVGDVYTFLASSRETGGAYALFEALVGPGGGPPPHRHTREQESFYILEGRVSFQADGQGFEAAVGTFVRIPIGVLHSFKNESARTARMLIQVTPGGLDRFFEEVGHPIGADGKPVPVTADDIERLMRMAPKYGIAIPPLA